MEKLTQNLVDIQYLLEPSDRKPVPTIPMLDVDEHIVDPFEIDPKLVDNIKERLFQEAEDMIAADKKSGMTGSRRSSKASISSRKSKKLSRQISASSRQSSIGAELVMGGYFLYETRTNLSLEMPGLQSSAWFLYGLVDTGHLVMSL